QLCEEFLNVDVGGRQDAIMARGVQLTRQRMAKRRGSCCDVLKATVADEIAEQPTTWRLEHRRQHVVAEPELVGQPGPANRSTQRPNERRAIVELLKRRGIGADIDHVPAASIGKGRRRTSALQPAQREQRYYLRLIHQSLSRVLMAGWLGRGIWSTK